LDDFEQSLRSDRSPIVDEVFGRLLHIAADHTYFSISKLLKQGVKPNKLIRNAYSQSKATSKNELTLEEEVPATAAPEITPNIPIIDEEIGELDVDDSTPEGNHVLKLMDYAAVGSWWRWKISPEVWENCLLAYLLHLATIRDIPSLPQIIEALAGEEPVLDSVTSRLYIQAKSPWKSLDIAANFEKLSVGQKLEILSFLISESVVPSNMARKSMDESLLEFTELKKEKRDIETRKREMY